LKLCAAGQSKNRFPDEGRRLWNMVGVLSLAQDPTFMLVGLSVCSFMHAGCKEAAIVFLFIRITTEENSLWNKALIKALPASTK
jgi:hypothetical protein